MTLSVMLRCGAASIRLAQLGAGQHARDDQHVFDAQPIGDRQRLRGLPQIGNAAQASSRRAPGRRPDIRPADTSAAIGEQMPGQRFARLIRPHDQRLAIARRATAAG